MVLSIDAILICSLDQLVRFASGRGTVVRLLGEHAADRPDGPLDEPGELRADDRDPLLLQHRRLLLLDLPDSRPVDPEIPVDREVAERPDLPPRHFRVLALALTIHGTDIPDRDYRSPKG